MEEIDNKYDSIDLVVYINELMIETEVTQYFKNTRNSPIELQMTIPKLSNNNLTKFEMTMNNKKIISKLLEKEKAKEKYTDAIATGNYGFISYNSKEETTICLGNIPPNEEIKLKSYFFGHIISKDYSYQASFPTIFPGFILCDPKNQEDNQNYIYKKQIVKGKIYIDTFSKLTRLVIKGSNNFGKIERKYENNYKSAEIDIYKDNFNEKDIPGIILFRTEEINKDKIFFQYDSKKDKSYYILHKTLEIPKFNLISKDIVDEDENVNYASLLEKKEEKESNYKKCYIFLLDQSGSMSGSRIELCNKALLLFLQSLNEDCFFQLIGFGSEFEYYIKEPLEYNKENINKLINIIKKLRADKGGTELYSPLKDIYNNKIYEKYNMNKHIILLTDGEIDDKENTLNLIGSHSNEFIFNSIGIEDCDKDLIERSALVGNGFSYFIDNLDNLNKIIISVLEKTQSEIIVECGSNQDNIIEDKKQKYIKINDFFRHGIIIDNNNKDINFNIKYNKKNENISMKNIEIKILPDGEELGKLIIDKYLSENNTLDSKTKIKLSKDYNILCSETAFFAQIQNEVPMIEKMTTITNKNKEAINNNIIIEQDDNEKQQESELRSIDSQKLDVKEKNNELKYKEKEGNEFNKIIKKKQFKLKYRESEEICCLKMIDYDICKLECRSAKKIKRGFLSCLFSVFPCKKKHTKIKTKSLDSEDDKSSHDNDLKCKISNNNSNNIEELYSENDVDKFVKNENSKNIDNKNNINFDDIILGQDIINGNWEKNNNIELLIKEENILYEKIKNFSENKGIKDENGIITLFILYYIYEKKNEKVEELKFIINKAKNYIKKIFNFDYDEIIKEI